MIRVYLSRLSGPSRSMPRWASWLTMAASVVVGIALFVLAASLALILIPIVLAVGAFFAWRLRSKLKAAGLYSRGPFPAQPQRDERRDVVDAEYRIVEPEDPRRR